MSSVPKDIFATTRHTVVTCGNSIGRRESQTSKTICENWHVFQRQSTDASLTRSPNGFVKPTRAKMTDFVFMTTASSYHVNEPIDAVVSVQTIMPTKKILVFNLGLKDEEIAKILCRWSSLRFDT